MFDFISYARDMGLEIKILPPTAGALACIELRDSKTGYFERHTITDKEAASCGNIDKYTGHVLDQMAARIGRRKAEDTAKKYEAHKRAEMETFWKHSKPSPLTEGIN